MQTKKIFLQELNKILRTDKKILRMLVKKNYISESLLALLINNLRLYRLKQLILNTRRLYMAWMKLTGKDRNSKTNTHLLSKIGIMNLTQWQRNNLKNLMQDNNKIIRQMKSLLNSDKQKDNLLMSNMEILKTWETLNSTKSKMPLSKRFKQTTKILKESTEN